MNLLTETNLHNDDTYTSIFLRYNHLQFESIHYENAVAAREKNKYNRKFIFFSQGKRAQLFFVFFLF